MTDELPAIRVVDLSKQHRIGSGPARQNLREALGAWLTRASRAGARGRTLWALRDVNLEVMRGEAVGIIGRNGAGKSTLLRILSRISAPTRGFAEIRGRVASLLEVGTGFHPELTGRENVFLNGAILGMRRAEIARKFDEIVEFSEVSEFLDTPVKRYSSGMRVRLAFAVAAHLDADVMLVDEVLAVGDVGFRNKCLGKMGEAARNGRSILFVSHSMPTVEALCQRVILIDQGRIVASGASSDVIARYYELNRAPRSTAAGAIGTSRDGSLAVTSLETLSPDGERLDRLQPGRDFVIRLGLRAQRPVGRAIVQLFLNDGLGARVVAFSSRSAGRELRIPAGESRVLCVAHDLPLAPATYDVDLRITVGMEELLLQRSAASFLVAESDYFKSGALPGECAAARCLVRQSWSQELP
jgi:lipopolysaccharide transport system ATP-binding protein